MNIRDLLKRLSDGSARYIVKRKSIPTPRRFDSKNIGAKRKPRNWHQMKRRKRKAQKLARRAHRFG